MGYKGAQLLFDLIQGKPDVVKDTLLTPKVIDRNTLKERSD